MSDRRHVFVLAIYPSTRGFAFVVFEGPLSPVDWGVKAIPGSQKNRRCLAAIQLIIDRFQPGAIVLQDTTPGGTRRADRIRTLNAAIGELAERNGIPTVAFSRAEVLKAFLRVGPIRNKHQLAELITKHIPAFEHYLPPTRRPWMSEDARMSLFDAAALALMFFQGAGGWDQPAPA
jgi:hypothetical protein